MTALQLRLVRPGIRRLGPNRAAITHRRSGADQISHWRLLLRRAHVHVGRLSAEPRRQQLVDNGFEIIDHGRQTHAAFGGFRRLAAGPGRRPVGGDAWR